MNANGHGRRLLGAKSILRYLKESHDLVICRQTLDRLRKVKGSGRGRLGGKVGPDLFPAATKFTGRSVTIAADSSAIDAWVARRLKRGEIDAAPFAD